MTLVQLQVFLAIIEEKSFTKAAEKLNMTQSAVSQTINALENELGVTLLIRNRNGVVLTHIGERMQNHAREIINLTRCMAEEANAARGMNAGSVRIGCIPGISTNVLPPLMKSFNGKYPNIKLVLFEGSESEIREWIADAVVDVGFITIHDEERFVSIPLLKDQIYAFLPKDHSLSGSASIPVSELVKETFIAPKNASFEFSDILFREAGASPQVGYEVREIPTILSMVQEGLGITILPGLDHPSPSSTNVARIPVVPPIYRSIGIGVRTLDKISPVVAEFILHAETQLKMH